MSPFFSFPWGRFPIGLAVAAAERPRVTFTARPRPPRDELRLAVSDLTARVRELRLAGSLPTRDRLRVAADALIEQVSTALGAGWGEQPRHVAEARDRLDTLMLGLIALVDEGGVALPDWRDVLRQVHVVRRVLDAMAPAEILPPALEFVVTAQAGTKAR